MIVIEKKGILAKYINTEYTHFVAQGLMFGYPECCIEAFIMTIKENKFPSENNFTINYKENVSGFIPCQKHKELILTNKIRLKDLIQDYRYVGLPKFKEKYLNLNKNTNKL